MSRKGRAALAALTSLVLMAASGGEAAQRKVLDNGLTVVLERDGASALTVLQILVKGGMRAEPPGKRGLAFLTARLSIEIPDSRKAQELIGLATRFSVAAQGDYSVINIECLSANLEASLKVLSKIFLDPLFSGIRIDAVKRHMEHQGSVEEDDSSRFGHLAGLRAFFAGTGYEGSPYGDRDSLDAVKNRDVSEFYKSCFVGPNVIMSFVSDLPEETLLDLAGRYFAELPSGEPLVFAPVPPSKPGKNAVALERDTKQSFVSLAFPLPGVSRRTYALAALVESLLGKGQGSRLWPLRAEKKLAYNVNCRATLMLEAGLVEAFLEVGAAKQEAARQALRAAVDELFRNGVTDGELRDAKNAALAEFVRDNESKAVRAGTLAFFEASGLGLDYVTGLSAEVEAITLEEVNSFLKDILGPDKTVEIVIGPKS